MRLRERSALDKSRLATSEENKLITHMPTTLIWLYICVAALCITPVARQSVMTSWKLPECDALLEQGFQHSDTLRLCVCVCRRYAHRHCFPSRTQPEYCHSGAQFCAHEARALACTVPTSLRKRLFIFRKAPARMQIEQVRLLAYYVASLPKQPEFDVGGMHSDVSGTMVRWRRWHVDKSHGDHLLIAQISPPALYLIFLSYQVGVLLAGSSDSRHMVWSLVDAACPCCLSRSVAAACSCDCLLRRLVGEWAGVHESAAV